MKDRSNEHEQHVAELVGGKRTLGSGSLWFQKSDVYNANFLFECKTTKNDHYSLKLEDLEYNMKNAYSKNKAPVFVVCFNNGESSKQNVFIVNFFDTDSQIQIKSSATMKRQIKIKSGTLLPSLLISGKRQFIIMPEETFINLFLENI
jgi:hypothetical protein